MSFSSHKRSTLPLPDEILHLIGLEVADFDSLPRVSRQFERVFNSETFKEDYLDRGALPRLIRFTAASAPPCECRHPENANVRNDSRPHQHNHHRNRNRPSNVPHNSINVQRKSGASKGSTSSVDMTRVTVPTFINYWARNGDTLKFAATYFWRLWLSRKRIAPSSGLPFYWVIGSYSMMCILFLRYNVESALQKVLSYEAMRQLHFPFYAFVALFPHTWPKQRRWQFDPKTLLHVPYMSRPQQLEFLMDHKVIDVSQKNSVAVYMAACLNKPRMLRIMLQDARVDPRRYHNGAIIQACSRGHVECVRVLLEHEGVTRVNPCDQNMKALLGAFQAGHRKCVQLLLADDRVDAYYGGGWTLFTSVERDWPEVVETIMKRADPIVDKQSSSSRSKGLLHKRCLLQAMDKALTLGRKRIAQILSKYPHSVKDSEGDTVMTSCVDQATLFPSLVVSRRP